MHSKEVPKEAIAVPRRGHGESLLCAVFTGHLLNAARHQKEQSQPGLNGMCERLYRGAEHLQASPKPNFIDAGNSSRIRGLLRKAPKGVM